MRKRIGMRLVIIGAHILPEPQRTVFMKAIYRARREWDEENTLTLRDLGLDREDDQ